MNLIGSIFCSKVITTHKKVDYVNYFSNLEEFLDFSRIKPDQNNYKTPFLYVGWNSLKKNNISHLFRVPEISILKKEIVKNQLFWEFDMEEDINGYFSGIDQFVANVPYYFINNFKYKIIDPCSVPDVSSIKGLLPSTFDSYIYKNEMIYIQSQNVITGIHLDSFKYFRYDVDEILNIVKSNSVHHFHDVEGLEYQKYYKKFPEFPYLKRSIVVFMF